MPKRYAEWAWRKRLWGMHTVDEPYRLWILISWLLRISAMYKAGWIGSIAWIVSANVVYAVTILPDHDTYSTAVNAKTSHSKDWGEAQVRESGNFGSPMLSWLFGGINLQIEHHLFPSLNHIHFETIAPVVRSTCKEFNIPYVYHSSVWAAVFDCIRNYLQD